MITRHRNPLWSLLTTGLYLILPAAATCFCAWACLPIGAGLHAIGSAPTTNYCNASGQSDPASAQTPCAGRGIDGRKTCECSHGDELPVARVAVSAQRVEPPRPQFVSPLYRFAPDSVCKAAGPRAAGSPEPVYKPPIGRHLLLRVIQC